MIGLATHADKTLNSVIDASATLNSVIDASAVSHFLLAVGEGHLFASYVPPTAPYDCLHHLSHAIRQMLIYQNYLILI